jgi:hypothetical protein
MAAECETTVRQEPCGVLAIGRCATCGHAFCSSHRAIDGYEGVLVDLCAECLRQEKVRSSESAAAQQAAARQQAKARKDFGEQIVEELRAVAAQLRHAGVATSTVAKPKGGSIALWPSSMRLSVSYTSSGDGYTRSDASTGSYELFLSAEGDLYTIIKRGKWRRPIIDGQVDVRQIHSRPNRLNGSANRTVVGKPSETLRMHGL